MSMINQMLKDLDKRHVDAGDAKEMTAGTAVASPVRRRSLRPVIPVLLVAAAAAGIGMVYWNSNEESPGQVAETSVKTASAPTRLPETPAVIPPVESAAGPTPSVPPSSSQPSAATSEQITETKVTAKPEAVAISAEPEKIPEAVAGPASEAKATKEPENTPSMALAHSPPSSLATSKGASARQRSDEFYRQAIASLRESRVAEAEQSARQAVGDNPTNHGARLFLSRLLADTGRNEEATTLLRDGLEFAPGHSGFSMALAGLQVVAGSAEDALATMEQGLFAAGENPEYNAFLAELARKCGRNDLAVRHYSAALRKKPATPGWLIGLGISLQAENRKHDAADAFQRAIDTGELPPDVSRFANQQLQQALAPR